MRSLLTLPSRVHNLPPACIRTLFHHLLFPPPSLPFSLTAPAVTSAARQNPAFLSLRPSQATAKVLQLAVSLQRPPSFAAQLLAQVPYLWTSDIEVAALKLHCVRTWCTGGHVTPGWLESASQARISRCIIRAGFPTLLRLAYLQERFGGGGGVDSVIDVVVEKLGRS